MADGAAIAIRGLGVRQGEREILRGVTFEAPPGGVLAVLGPNGAGKTTLLRVLATLLPPTRGEVRILGLDARRDAVALRAGLGYVAHHTFLYPQLTGWENLWFWARAFGVPRAEERIRELLVEVGLELFAHEPVRRYSRGMQQRLALARALIHDPSLLLLDEPYTGLDHQGSALLDRVVDAWRKRGRSVVVTSHDLGRALAVSDRVLVLRRGEVVLFAASEDVEVSDIEWAGEPAAPVRTGGATA